MTIHYCSSIIGILEDIIVADLNLPKFICAVCKKKRQVVEPGKKICIYCKKELHRSSLLTTSFSVPGRGDNKGKRVVRTTKKRVQQRLPYHPDDYQTLCNIAKGETTPTFLYNQALLRRRGRCGHCGKVEKQMRVIPSRYRSYIKTIYCPACYEKRGDVIVVKPVKQLNDAQRAWKQMDLFMRVALSSNTRFVNELTSPAKADIIDVAALSSSEEK